jgi:hypothetical protein
MENKMTEIRLHRSELEKIVKLLDRFSDVNNFSLLYQTNGIGTNLDIQFNYKLVDLDATVTLPVTGVESW